MEVTVGPLVITIHDDDQFLVCEPDACVLSDQQQGYFAADTRLVSTYLLTLCGVQPLLVNSSATAPFSSRFEFINSRVRTIDGEIDEGEIHLRLDRTIGSGLHEDYDITNYSSKTVQLDLEIRVEGDYADLFSVKDSNLVRRGFLQTSWEQKEQALTTVYLNEDFRRGLRIQAVNHDSEPEFANGIISFRVRLAPRESWHTCVLWMPIVGDHPPSRPLHTRCHALLGSDTLPDRLRIAWGKQATKIRTGNPVVSQIIEQAVADLGAMRIRRHDEKALGPGADDTNAWVPAAGVPWFVSLFGRDALIVSLQTPALSPHLALAALRALGAWQGAEYDDSRDLQPGKILHEWRQGELAHFHLVPQTPYYGTHEATSLYVWAAGEVWRWMGKRSLMEEIRPNVERALEWIDKDGDSDGDGLQEYKTRAGRWGYYNQGWKDSGDAIVHADGRLAELPLALCELQGYVVAAKRSWAQVLEEAFREPAKAAELRAQADQLAAAIEERFWWGDEGTYYLGLAGPDRTPIKTVASNAGHLLWSGAVSKERAAKVAERLMAPDMWSGWGVRTLSADHPCYNPFSYQRGSVWPHDNSILAAGFLNYGRRDAGWSIAHAVFDAAAAFQNRRLPEVFAGLQREPGAFPAQFLGANVPQAWASGAIIQLVAAIIGLQPNAADENLAVAEAIPSWLGAVSLSGLAVGEGKVDLEVDSVGAAIKTQTGNLQLRKHEGSAGLQP